MKQTPLVSLVVVSLTIGIAIATSGQLRQTPSSPQGKITPWEAMNIAVKRTGGHAINANFEFDDGHWVYGVMVVSKGRLKEVEIDTMSGKIAEIEDATPAGEAKEIASDLNRALKSG